MHRPVDHTHLSLDEIEGFVWPEPEIRSRLSDTVLRLRRRPIGDLAPDEIRILIGQGHGLVHLIPLALDALESGPFVLDATGRGALLDGMLHLDSEHWEERPKLRRRMERVLERLARPPREARGRLVEFRRRSPGR